MSEHRQFVELCALYTAGSISDAELNRLDGHLEGCAECRKVLEEFQELACLGLPSIAPDFADVTTDALPENGRRRTQRRLLERIESAVIARRQPLPRHGGSLFRHLRVPLAYAAAVLVTTSVGFFSYRFGLRHEVQGRADSLRSAVARLSVERDVLASTLHQKDRTIGTLTEQAGARAGEIASLKQQQEQLAETVESSRTKRESSDLERAVLARKVVDALASLELTQKALDGARSELAADLAQLATLERRLTDATGGIKQKDQTIAVLTQKALDGAGSERAADSAQVATLQRRLTDAVEGIKQKDQTIQEQRDLLEHDRDIRDLIGARDLYVAEVNDVDRDARTQTPFGRVFYTKGKSLIFYAYDLDKQPGLRRASTFQAWGRRGSDFGQALPLGLLYLDNSTNRRWVLKFDDPQALARIDAVFVTVEPKGGSHKPSGKPLLFAYLKVEPNHP